jgi:thiamine-phosphate pyrophosphorylase
VDGGVDVVQLREKRSDGKLFYEKALAVKQMLSETNVPLIINDRVDVALAIGADGVHLGQSDLPLPAVKKIIPETMIVGISAATLEEATEAERNGADYIGVGALFSTSSKQDATLLPEGMLEDICRQISIPVIAIGGLTAERLQTLSNSGISGAAIVSAIMGAPDPRLAAMELKNVLL